SGSPSGRRSRWGTARALETARQRDAAVGVVAQPSRSSSYRRDVQMLLADIHTNPRAGCGHRVPALSAALSLATVRADDRGGRDRATRRLAPVVGCDLRPREAIPPRGDRFTDTVPESRETRLGQGEAADPTHSGFSPTGVGPAPGFRRG